MPIGATAVATPILTVDDIRGYLRDYVGQIRGTGAINILLDGLEFSHEDLLRSIKLTTSRYNAMTPISTLGADQINSWVLLNGCVAFLLRSESLRQIRNQASTQDGDVPSIGIDDKGPLYAQMAKTFDDEFMLYARGIKTETNMSMAYGGIGSGYRSVSRFNHA